MRKVLIVEQHVKWLFLKESQAGKMNIKNENIWPA